MFFHWKRNFPRPAEDTDTVKGSPEVAAVRQGLNDPGSIWSKLAGLEDSVVPLILSFTEYSVVSCTCCRDRPVVFCCHRRKRIAKDTRGKRFEDFGPPPDQIVDSNGDGEGWDECPEHFIWNAQPNDVVVENIPGVTCSDNCRYIGRKERKIPEGAHFHTPNMYPSGSRTRETCTYIVVNDEGFHSAEKNFSWSDSHRHQPCLNHPKQMQDGYFFFVDENLVYEKNLGLVLVPGQRPERFYFHYMYVSSGTYGYRGPWKDLAAVMIRFRILQRRFRAQSWLGRIGKENPQHLRELYDRLKNGED